jgi:hypothetical protein
LLFSKVKEECYEELEQKIKDSIDVSAIKEGHIDLKKNEEIDNLLGLHRKRLVTH